MKKGLFSLLMAALLAGGSVAHAQIAITEFMLNPAGGQDTLSPEWVELFNYSPDSVSIAGWSLYDADNDSLVITYDATQTAQNYKIPSGGYAILTNNKTLFESVWLTGTYDIRVVKVNISANLKPGAAYFALGNSGDEISLKNNATGAVSWSVAYPTIASATSLGRGTFLDYATNFATAPTIWGTKAAPGVVFQGVDAVAGSPVGYTLNSTAVGTGAAVDPLLVSKVNGHGTTNIDFGSPLAGSYVALTPAGDDLGVLAISAPASGIGLTGTEPVTISVKNHGSTSISAYSVSYQINGGTPVTEAISTALASGATTSYTFAATANLAAYQSYALKAWTTFAGDVSAANDTASQTVVNTAPVTDLGVTAVSAPVSGIGLTATEAVTVTVTNAGNVAVNSYNVSFGVNGGTPVTETVNTAIAAGATATYTFTATANLAAFQSHTVCAYTTVAGDVTAANDTTCATVINTAPPTEDLALTSITSPVSGVGLTAAEAVTISVQNVGTTTIATYGIAYSINGGAPVSQVIFTPIASGATATHTFVTPANLSAPGTYTVWAGATSMGDLNHLNDSTHVTVVNTAVVNDLQVNALYLPASSYTLTSAETVGIKLTNNGNVSAANFAVSYTVNGGAAVNETYTASLVPGAVDTFYFATLADFSAYDTFDVCGTATLANDATPANNTVCGTTIHRQPYTGPNTLAVTEIFNDPFGVDNAREFVEIYNYGNQPIDLKDWKLRDADVDSAWISHNASFILPAGGYAVLCQNKDSLQNHYFGGAAQANILTYVSAPPMIWALSNTSDEVMLKNPDGLIVWSAAYAEDDVIGRAAFLEYSWDFNSNITTFGSKATPGIVRAGNDLITPPSLGYQTNSITADIDSIVATTGNVASPLRGHYVPLFPDNAGVTAISSPVSGVGLGSAEAVTVTVKNFGTNALSNIPVAFTVNNSAPVTETVAGPLAPGATTTYTFTASANLASPIAYAIVAYTDLAGETMRNNDTTKVTVVNTPVNNDAAATALISPVTGMGLTATESISITVSNVGATTLSNIPVGVLVNGVPVSSGTVPGPVAPGGSTTFTFAQTADLSAAGPYVFTIFTAFPNDVNTANDTLEQLVESLAVQPNVGVVAILTPNGSQVFTATETVTVVIENFGNVDATFFPVNYAYDNGSGSLAYTEVLAVGQKDTLSFTTTADLSTPGGYTFKAFTSLSGDINVADDTAMVSVVSLVGIADEVGLNLYIAPNPAKDMITIRLDQATNSPVAVALYDMAGKLVTSKTYSPADNFEAVLKVDDLPAGVYTLSVNSGLHSAVRKVVVE